MSSRIRQPLFRWHLLDLFLVLASLAFVHVDGFQSPLGYSASLNSSLLWGPYRPNLYFGLRPRLPKSLLTGLLWANVDSFTNVQSSTSVHCGAQSVD